MNRFLHPRTDVEHFSWSEMLRALFQPVVSDPSTLCVSGVLCIFGSDRCCARLSRLLGFDSSDAVQNFVSGLIAIGGRVGPSALRAEEDHASFAI